MGVDAAKWMEVVIRVHENSPVIILIFPQNRKRSYQLRVRLREMVR